jgi:hypothetical protein
MTNKVYAALIEALKQGGLTEEDVRKIIISNTESLTEDALRKRRKRYLTQLKERGLIKERDGKYFWYIYPNLFENIEDLNTKLKHSSQLIPGLEALAGLRGDGIRLAEPHEEYVNPFNLKILSKCAEEHLGHYKEVYSLLNDCRAKNKEYKKLQEELEGALREKLRKEFGEPMDEIDGQRVASFVGKIIPQVIFADLIWGSFSDLELRGEDIRAHGQAGGIVVAKGSHLFKNLKEFFKRETEDKSNVKAAELIRESEGKYGNVRKRLEVNIRELMIRIRGGEPLKGRCDTCPEILIKK